MSKESCDQGRLEHSQGATDKMDRDGAGKSAADPWLTSLLKAA